MYNFDAIVFDVDSTLVKIEGLDWLAHYKAKGDEVKHLTRQSMEGSLDFQTAMVRKMRTISPSLNDLQKLGETYCQNIVEGAEEVVSVFQQLGKEVWILTGNFEIPVQILAAKLHIPTNHVICNRTFLSESGEYLGFDIDNALSQNGGKAKKISVITNGGLKKVIFVGDGMTDLEVKDHVSMFIGFGGVAEREIVKQNAHIYISESSLLPILKILNLNKPFKTSS